MDYIVTLGGTDRPRRGAIGCETQGSTAKIATFDTNAELVDAIKARKVEWAVGIQQPFLQGRDLAIDSLWLYLKNGERRSAAGSRTLTGCRRFIDESNIDAVADLCEERDSIAMKIASRSHAVLTTTMSLLDFPRVACRSRL